jgi:hypothetical protein
VEEPRLERRVTKADVQPARRKTVKFPTRRTAASAVGVFLGENGLSMIQNGNPYVNTFWPPGVRVKASWP